MSYREMQPDSELDFGPDSEQFMENNCPNFVSCPYMRDQYFDPTQERQRRRRRRPYYNNRPYYPYPYFSPYYLLPFLFGRDDRDYD